MAHYGPDPWAASDHDPIVIGFNILLGGLTDDGAVDSSDQQLITEAIGKSASSADRRIDYDGDGKITLNDHEFPQFPGRSKQSKQSEQSK